MAARRRAGSRRVGSLRRWRPLRSTSVHPFDGSAPRSDRRRKLIMAVSVVGVLGLVVVGGTAAAKIGEGGGFDFEGGSGTALQKPPLLDPVIEGPPVAAPDAPTARFDYRVPEGARVDRDGNGLPDLVPPRVVVHREGGYPIVLDGCPSTAPTSPIVKYEWAVELPGDMVRGGGPNCLLDVLAPAQGTYPVTLTVTAENGQTATTTGKVRVRDYLIVSMGDSFASGEVPAIIGTPDLSAEPAVPGAPGPPTVPSTNLPLLKPAVWADQACHRSWNSGPARAAMAIEKADPRTSVTFVSVACSGGTIDTGMLNPYPDPPGGAPNGQPVPPQVETVRRLLCESENSRACLEPFPNAKMRHIDALMIGVGGNDIGFSTIIKECGQLDAQGPDCYNRPYLTTFLRTGLEALPRKFSLLNEKIRKHFSISDVYLTEYPDGLTDDDGFSCEKVEIVDAGPADVNGVINGNEVKWARAEVQAPLNFAVAAAAKEHGWHLVNGIAGASTRHGYCADDHWMVRFEESQKRIQADENGAFHPNAKGHESIAFFLQKQVTDHLPSATNPTLSDPNCDPTKPRGGPGLGDPGCG
jgi:hypothetical protein